MTVKIIDSSVLRANLGDAINEVKMGAILEVRRRGKSEAAIISMDTLEDWLEAQDPEYIESIKHARAQREQGKTVPFENVYREIMGANG